MEGEILLVEGYGGQTLRATLKEFEEVEETLAPTLFRFSDLREQHIIIGFGLKYCEEETRFGDGVEDIARFVRDVSCGSPSRISFESDLAGDRNKGVLLFSGTHFMYPIFSCGRLQDYARVVFEADHVCALQELLRCMESV
jgi:hypothetical protein